MKRILILSLLVTSMRLYAQTPVAAASGDAAPLPDISTLLHDVEVHEQANLRAAHDFLYTATRVTTNADGRTHSTEIEFTIVDGIQTHRVVARDGKPLPPDQAAHEEQKAEKEAAKARERRQKAAREGKSTDSMGEPVITAARLLELATVANLHREPFRGRSTIVFSFAGDRKTKTHNIGEEIVTASKGTAWIDERDHELAHLEANLPNGFHIGWGLIAEVSKGSGITADIAPVRDGVWLPTSFTGHGQLRRFLFSKPIDGTFRVTYSNYRRFGSSVTILPGAQPVTDAPPTAPAAPKP
jgi:hypothetical protein